MNDVYDTFLTKSDWAYDHIVPISPDASNRKYFRLTSRSGSAILMDAELESPKSFDAFQDVANYLNSIGLSAPEIYASDRTHRLMLLQDLGVRTFAQDLEIDQALEPERYKAAISMLCRLQAGPGMKRSVATPDNLTEMLNPFFEVPEVANCTHGNLQLMRTKLHELFNRSLSKQSTLSLRDCHVENLVWIPNRTGPAQVGILDFQDAFNCDPCYDLVSLLWDVRRDLDEDLREYLINSFAFKKGIDRTQISRAINALKLQRNLRILGIFDRLVSQGKTKYATFVPRTLRYVHQALESEDCVTLNADLSLPLERYERKYESQ
ncbi:MAG: aminoglycoside phosphotransferase family protein [Paracoccaceae bacterium]